MPVFGRTEPEIDHAGGDADDTGHQKRGTPGQHRGQRRSDAGRERDAEIAAHAIERECASAFLGVLDNHCGTDRMINRRKQAERKQGNGEQGQRRSEGRRYERNAAADIEGHHQIAPAQMIERMGPIEKSDGEPPRGFGGTVVLWVNRHGKPHRVFPSPIARTYSLPGGANLPGSCKAAIASRPAGANWPASKNARPYRSACSATEVTMTRVRIPRFANGSPISADDRSMSPADVLAFIQGEQAKWGLIVQEIAAMQTQNK